MDRQTAAIYKRGALFVVPVVLIVGCRVGLRACVFLGSQDARRERLEEAARLAEARQQADLPAPSAQQASPTTTSPSRMTP
jgi:hypothetical protein